MESPENQPRKKKLFSQEIFHVMKMSKVSTSFWNLGHANSGCINVYLHAFIHSFISKQVFLSMLCFKCRLFGLCRSWIISHAFTDVWEEMLEYATASDSPGQGQGLFPDLMATQSRAACDIPWLSRVLARDAHWLVYRDGSGHIWAMQALPSSLKVLFYQGRW